MAGCLEVATRAPLAPPLPACGERSILRAEPWRSEANRVRGLVHKLRLAANAPSPGFLAALGIRPLPAPGERWRKWVFLALQDTNSNAIALPCRGREEQAACAVLQPKRRARRRLSPPPERPRKTQ